MTFAQNKYLEPYRLRKALGRTEGSIRLRIYLKY